MNNITTVTTSQQTYHSMTGLYSDITNIPFNEIRYEKDTIVIPSESVFRLLVNTRLENIAFSMKHLAFCSTQCMTVGLTLIDVEINPKTGKSWVTVANESAGDCSLNTNYILLYSYDHEERSIRKPSCISNTKLSIVKT